MALGDVSSCNVPDDRLGHCQTCHYHFLTGKLLFWNTKKTFLVNKRTGEAEEGGGGGKGRRRKRRRRRSSYCCLGCLIARNVDVGDT